MQGAYVYSPPAPLDSPFHIYLINPDLRFAFPNATADGDALEKQAHAGMVFYELSEGHREAVTEKLKSDVEQLRDDFAKAGIKPPDDMVEFFKLLGDAK